MRRYNTEWDGRRYTSVPVEISKEETAMDLLDIYQSLSRHLYETTQDLKRILSTRKEYTPGCKECAEALLKITTTSRNSVFSLVFAQLEDEELIGEYIRENDPMPEENSVNEEDKNEDYGF